MAYSSQNDLYVNRTSSSPGGCAALTYGLGALAFLALLAPYFLKAIGIVLTGLWLVFAVILTVVVAAVLVLVVGVPLLTLYTRHQDRAALRWNARMRVADQQRRAEAQAKAGEKAVVGGDR